MSVDPTQIVLDALAVAEDELTLSHLAKIAASLGVRVQRRVPTTAQIQEWVDALVRERLVIQSGRVGMPRAQAEVRARMLIGSGRYAEVADQVAAAEPMPTETWRSPRPGTLFRELRRALLSADDAGTRAILARARPSPWTWFAEPVDPMQIRMLSPFGAGVVLDQLSRTAILRAQPLPGFLEILDEMLELHGTMGLAGVRARQAWLRGEGDRFDALTAQIGDQLPQIAALHALVRRGDPELATTSYAAHLTQERKRLGTTRVVPAETEALLLPLAFASSKQKTRPAQARRLIELADDHGFTRSDLPWAGWLHVWALLDPTRPSPQPGSHPLAVLNEALCSWWQDVQVPPARIKAAITSARAAGWSWVVDELEAGPGGQGLVALRAVRSEWQHRLDSLAQAIGGGSVRKAAAPADKRLAWTLWQHGSRISLEAREQVRKGADWSVGKPIANKRLLGEGKPFALTPADRAVIAALRSSSQRNWRGYAEISYSWDAVVAWPALIGHPAVFNTAGDPVTVVGAPPRLIVSKVKGATVLRVEPKPGADRVIVVQVGNGFEVTVFDKQQLKIAELLEKELRIPAAGGEALDAFLAASEGLFAQAPSGGRPKEVPGDPTVVALLRPEGRAVSVEFAVQPIGEGGPRFAPGAGSKMALAEVDGAAVRIRRDLQAESTLLDGLLDLPMLELTGPDRGVLADPQACLGFLEALREAEVPVYWPEGQEIRFRGTATASQLHMRVSDVERWFHASGSLEIDDALTLSLAALLQAVLESDGRFVRLEDGSFLALEAQLRRQLDLVARTAQKRAGQVAVHPLASEGLADLVAWTNGEVDEGFTDWIERQQSIPEDLAIPSGLQATLRGYQEDALRWLVRVAHLGAGAVLADDMGLGKTVVSIALLLHRRSEGPALVLAPTSVAGNWVRELVRFAPSLSGRRLREASDRAALVAGVAAGDVLICSYGLLVTEAETLASIPWGTVIFDESQALKNPATQRHKAALTLAAGFRLALTGTPIENHLGELHAQFAIVNPSMLGGKTAFARNFQRPIESGDHGVRRQLKGLVAPYLLRRTKAQVLDELPPRIDIDLPIELDPAEAALYEAQRRAALEQLESRSQTDSAVDVLAHLTRLRLLACSPRLVLPDHPESGSKLRAFAAVARNLQSGGHRALVFSQFVKHLALIREWLDGESVAYQYLDGSTPARQRDAAVAAFQGGDDPFFLISTRAGGQGLNLTAADYVIHLDPWWNPAVEDQASDRAHRIGQSRPVTVYRLYAQGTVEEQILALHKSKRSLADGILEGADAAGRLSASELLALMRAG